MAKSRHLTRGDLRFLAAVSPDTGHKYDAILSLEQEVIAAAEAAGVAPDLSGLDGLAAAHDAGLLDPDRLDAIRSDLRHQLGAIGRGEFRPTEVNTDVHE